MVCHQGRIKGQPGVALDDLVYICTKIARQMDAQVRYIGFKGFKAPGAWAQWCKRGTYPGNQLVALLMSI